MEHPTTRNAFLLEAQASKLCGACQAARLTPGQPREDHFGVVEISRYE
jgi:hypothetical protein